MNRLSAHSMSQNASQKHACFSTHTHTSRNITCIHSSDILCKHSYPVAPSRSVPVCWAHHNHNVRRCLLVMLIPRRAPRIVSRHKSRSRRRMRETKKALSCRLFKFSHITYELRFSARLKRIQTRITNVRAEREVFRQRI